MRSLRFVLAVMVFGWAVPAWAQAPTNSGEAEAEETPESAEASTEAAPAPCPRGLECYAGADGVRRAYRRSRIHRNQPDLMVIGAAMLGGAWLVNLGASIPGAVLLGQDMLSNTRGGDYLGWSFVPLIGPVAQMFQLGDEHWAIPLLAITEAIEVVGLIIAAVGTAGEDVTILEPVAGLTIQPWADQRSAGLRVGGAF